MQGLEVCGEVSVFTSEQQEAIEGQHEEALKWAVEGPRDMQGDQCGLSRDPR